MAVASKPKKNLFFLCPCCVTRVLKVERLARRKPSLFNLPTTHCTCSTQVLNGSFKTRESIYWLMSNDSLSLLTRQLTRCLCAALFELSETSSLQLPVLLPQVRLNCGWTNHLDAHTGQAPLTAWISHQFVWEQAELVCTYGLPHIVDWKTWWVKWFISQFFSGEWVIWTRIGEKNLKSLKFEAALVTCERGKQNLEVEEVTLSYCIA